MLVKTRLATVDLGVKQLLGNRIMAVKEGQMIAALAGMAASYVKEGTILMLRGGTYSRYETVEDAISALRQAIAFYGNGRRGETAEVKGWRSRTESLMADLLNFDRLYVGVNFESVIMGFASELSGKSAKHKVAAKKLIAGAASMTDKLGRRNPWRQMLLLAHADGAFEKRIKEAKEIKGHLVERLLVLTGLYRESALVIRVVKETIGVMLEARSWEAVGAANSAEGRMKAISACYRLVDLLNDLSMAPFIVYRNLTLGDLYAAIGALHAGRTASAKVALDHAYSGSRIGLAHIRLERIRSDISLSAKRGQVDINGGLVRMSKFVANLDEINSDGLIVSYLELVKAAIESACDSLRAERYCDFDGHLDRAIRLL